MLAPTIPSRTKAGGGLGTDFDLDGGLQPVMAFGGNNTGFGVGKHGDPAFTISKSHSNGDAVADAPIPFDTTQITSKANRSKPQAGEPDHPLAATAHASAIAFSSKNFGADAADEISPTIMAGGHSKSHANAGVPPPVALRAADWPKSVPPTLDAHFGEKQGLDNQHVDNGAGLFVSGEAQWRVRRLTPLECEKLQGLPPNHTRIPIRKYPQPVITDLRPEDMWEKIDGEWWLMSADGSRYKAIGNGMAAPVIGWILKRIVEMQP